MSGCGSLLEVGSLVFIAGEGGVLEEEPGDTRGGGGEGVGPDIAVDVVDLYAGPFSLEVAPVVDTDALPLGERIVIIDGVAGGKSLQGRKHQRQQDM